MRGIRAVLSLLFPTNWYRSVRPSVPRQQQQQQRQQNHHHYRHYRWTVNMSTAASPQGLSSQKDEDLPRIDSETPVASTKWLALKTLQWTDQEGKPRQWDVATRTTKPADKNKPDAVVIIPLLQSPTSENQVDTLLVEQFRPPVGQSTFEFPAGLIDADETAVQAALRELREETGYVGEACKIPPVESRAVCMSPGVCDETVQVVVVHVDMSNPYNQNPKPELDPGEHVTVQRVPLQQGIQRLMEQGTSMPIMGLYLFAIGYELGASNNKMPTKEQGNDAAK